MTKNTPKTLKKPMELLWAFDVASVGIKPLKAKHDLTKLNLTILLLSFWCVDINLSIQLMSLTSYMTCVH